MNNQLSVSELEYIVSRVLDNAKDAAESKDKAEFTDGKKLAYYEILDTIKNELIARNIDLKPFGLDIPLEDLL